MTVYDYNSSHDFDERWGDIRSDLRRSRVEVEWGRATPRNRRARTLQPSYGSENKRSWVTLAGIVIALALAIVIATFASMNLMNAPAQKEEDPDKVLGPVATPPPTTSPSEAPSGTPSEVPSTQPSESPTIAHSQKPSVASSLMPSMASASPSQTPSSAPTIIQKAPPALNVTTECVNYSGLFLNHNNEQVGCDWFDTQGTYAFIKNCGKTEVGRACLVSCFDFNDCVMPPTPIPITYAPSTSPSTAPTEAPPESLTFIAAEDSSIKKDNPDVNLGSSSYLKVDADSGTFHTLIRFDLHGHDFTRPVESASLRLKAASNCPFGGYVERTVHSNWNENTVTWTNAPDGEGEEVARFQSINTGYWYSVDILSALHPDKAHLSLRLFPISTNECLFVSKDHANGEGPELRVIYA